MKKVLPSLVLSASVLMMAPHAWGQTAGNTEAPMGSSSFDKKDSGTAATGRSKTGMGSSSMQSDRSGMASDRGAMGQRGAGHQLSKENVKEVQAALKNKGMDPGPEDGIMGPKTRSALREFQKSNNLQATGRIDEKTASALGVDIASAGAGMGAAGTSGRSGMSGSDARGAGSSGMGAGSKASEPDNKASNVLPGAGPRGGAGKQE